MTDYGQSRGYDAYHYGHPADSHCVDRRVAINQCIVVIDVHDGTATAALCVCVCVCVFIAKFHYMDTDTDFLRRNSVGSVRVRVRVRVVEFSYYCSTHGVRQRLFATWTGFQHSVVYHATDQCWKKTGTIINAERMVTLNTCRDIACPTFQLPRIATGSLAEPPTTTHNWLYSEPPTSESLRVCVCV